MSDTREDARDEARRLIHGDDIDQHGQPIRSPLDEFYDMDVADHIAGALTRDLMQLRNPTIELTAEVDDGGPGYTALNVTAWAKDSTGRTVSKDYVLEVREA